MGERLFCEQHVGLGDGRGLRVKVLGSQGDDVGLQAGSSGPLPNYNRPQRGQGQLGRLLE